MEVEQAAGLATPQTTHRRRLALSRLLFFAVGKTSNFRMDERLDRAGFIDAILQRPPAKLSGGPVPVTAEFLQQNLG